MRRSTFALAGVTVALCAPVALADGTIDFEDLVFGDTYMSGDMVTTGGVDLTFVGASSASVDDNTTAGGSGLEMVFFGDASFDFDFGEDVAIISLLYGAFGGTVTLEVNNDAVTVNGDFTNLPATVGGVDVVPTFDPTNAQGTLFLDGTISQFRIGGQEFALDDVTYRAVPAPFTALGALAFLATTRRRRA